MSNDHDKVDKVDIVFGAVGIMVVKCSSSILWYNRNVLTRFSCIALYQ